MGQSILLHVKSCSINRFPHYDQNMRHYLGRSTRSFTFPVTVSSAGSGRWGPAMTLRNNNSSMCSIEMVTMGNAVVTQNDRSYTINPGEVYILHIGGHHVYGTGPARVLHKRFAVLSGPSLDSILLATGLRGVDKLCPSDPLLVAGILRDISRVLDMHMGTWEVDLSSLAFKLLTVLGSDASSPYPELVKCAIEFMERNLNRQIWIKDLCSHLGVSEAHFIRNFHKQIGMPPMKYFQEQRMKWAKRLLLQTTISIKEVAATIGFDDPLYFSAQFKKQVGQSPGSFRQEKRSWI